MIMLHFDSIVYGPVHSRRLGSSLGVNLLPTDGKLCSFDCIYCECGWNRDNFTGGSFPSPEAFRTALRASLEQIAGKGPRLDSITFSGNGEPTLNPHFPEIVDIAVELRDSLAPGTALTVLSNATTCWKPEIFAALRKVDSPVMKIDAATQELAAKINKPVGNYDLQRVVSSLKAFEGDFILQTMFLRCGCFDSASPENLEGWKNIVRTLRPREVMAYSIARETPQKALYGYTEAEIRAFVQPLADEGFHIKINA